jgi:hypothetical protein
MHIGRGTGESQSLLVLGKSNQIRVKISKSIVCGDEGSKGPSTEKYLFYISVLRLTGVICRVLKP